MFIKSLLKKDIKDVKDVNDLTPPNDFHFIYRKDRKGAKAQRGSNLLKCTLSNTYIENQTL